VCVCRGVVFLFLDGKMVDFGDCSLTVLASLRLETMWMRLFHDGKGVSRFETKRSIHFGDFLHIHDDFAIKNATNILFQS
jgi:hypothetical protein